MINNIRHLTYISDCMVNLVIQHVESVLSQWKADWSESIMFHVTVKNKTDQLFGKNLIMPDVNALFSGDNFSLFPTENSDELQVAKHILGCDTLTLSEEDLTALGQYQNVIFDSLNIALNNHKSIQKVEQEFGCCFLVEICGQPFDLYVSFKFINRMRENSHLSQTLPPFCVDHESISKQSLKLKLNVNSEKIRVSQLCNLQAGDVIPLRQTLNKPFEFSVQDNRQTVKGYLVNHSNYKAVILD